MHDFTKSMPHAHAEFAEVDVEKTYLNPVFFTAKAQRDLTKNSRFSRYVFPYAFASRR
jgi:hypothetical protein